MKRIIVLVSLVVLFVGSSISFAAGGSIPGSGTEFDPYLIEDRADLDYLIDNYQEYDFECYIDLMADIDLAGTVYSGYVLPGLKGVFRGNNHTISNVSIIADSEHREILGFFAKLSDWTAEVRNLNLINIDIVSDLDSSYVGGLCGMNERARIRDCTVVGKITGENIYHAGLLTGISHGGIIASCFTSGHISCCGNGGGLVGTISTSSGGNCLIYNCGSAASVTGESFIGGFFGSSHLGIVENCYATGSVTGYHKNSIQSRNFGGFCGHNGGRIFTCYSTGRIDTSSYVNSGGFCGYNFNGDTTEITIENCMWDTDTSGTEYPGIYVNDAIGYPTFQMQDQFTFTNSGYVWKWIFADEPTSNLDYPWLMASYPILSWQGFQMSAVPDIINSGIEQAVASLASANLVLGDVSYDFNPIIPAGSIIDQTPEEGVSLVKWDMVDCIVSLGPYPIVPDVTGISRDQAEQAIVDARLNVGRILFVGSDTVPAGVVVSQTPEAGLVLHDDYQVNINISTGNCPLSGSGTSMDPYQINSLSDFDQFCDSANYEYFSREDICTKLNCDIDLSGRVYTQAIAGAFIDHPVYKTFYGKFDGNGHKISNFMILSTSSDPCGFFAVVNKGASVTGLTLENCTMEADDLHAGMLAGGNQGTISDCTVENMSCTSSSGDCGGLVGINYSEIHGCITSGIIHARNNVGGLVGQHYSGTISNCISNCDVYCQAYNAGGFVGQNTSYISDCMAYGSVNYIDETEAKKFGGFAGENFEGTILRSGSTGDVNINGENSGGFCGNHYKGLISMCYSTGNVTSTSIGVGGFIGRTSAQVSECYARGNVSGKAYVGMIFGIKAADSAKHMYATGTATASGEIVGVLGDYSTSLQYSFWDVESSGYGTNFDFEYGTQGLITERMQRQNTYVDEWDFIDRQYDGDQDIWRMPYEMPGYPILAWQKDIPGDIAGDYGVDMQDFALLAIEWEDKYDMTDLYQLAEFWLAGKQQ